uniref:Aldehyde dehydrogenase n=1 Tax=Hucho hucho TaxID=62062 RepID=A0A4W5PMD7_9TELE
MEKQAVQRAREAFLAGRSRPLEFRVQQLKSLQRMITDRQGEIATALKQDINRSQYDTPLFELIGLENEISLAVSKLAQWAAPRPVERNLLTVLDQVPYGRLYHYTTSDHLHLATLLGTKLYLEPKMVLPLSPLNNPFNRGFYVKPKRVLCETQKAGPSTPSFPTTVGVFYSAMSLHPSLTRTHSIIHLSSCLARITWGKFVNCGQTCIAPDYILCEPSIQNRVVEGIRQTLLEFYGPDPKSSPDYGRIINQRHFNRVMALLEGYTATLGGQSDASQRYIAPTVVKDVPPQARLMQEEIFGPLLPIVTVSDIDDAIHFINEREKPLALYVFSSNKKVIKRMLAETTSGGVTVNDVIMHYTLNSLPFGGVGQSGTGRYHGKHTFDQFSHHRACLVKSLGMEEVNMARYPPQNRQKARRVRLAMRTPLVDFSRKTYIWAPLSSTRYLY